MLINQYGDDMVLPNINYISVFYGGKGIIRIVLWIDNYAAHTIIITFEYDIP